VVSETWLSVDYPMLCAIIEVEAEGQPGLMIDGAKILERVGLEMSKDEWIRSVLRLQGGGYIEANVNRGGGGVMACIVMGATAAGRRVSGQWPPDDAYLSLVQVFNDRIEAAPDDATKSRLRTALDGILGVGRELGVDLAAEWLKRMTMGA
jgi:hypothetical protein